MKYSPVQLPKSVSKMFAALCILACLLIVASAQSGRKPTKPTKPSPPSTDADSGSTSTTTTTTKPDSSTPAEPSRDVKRSQINVLIADNGFGRDHEYGKIMLDSFVRRLGETQTISTSYIGVLKKNQATARIKDEKQGCLIYVNIVIDRFNNGGVGYSIPDMTFYYSVYAAGSDQEKSKGKVRYENYRTSNRGPIGLPSPIPTTTNGTMTPEETGRAAADQALYAIQSNIKPAKQP